MRYGESAFDILYLLFAIVSGCYLLVKARNRTEKQMGLAALILGCGDAFHLLPRVLNYFSSADWTAALGIGKLVTSLTMTVFYVLLYYIWLGYFKQTENRRVSALIWALAALRMILCAFPQNGWIQNSSDLTWSIIRNIPFAALGAIICLLYYRRKDDSTQFRPVWVYVLLSFLFYLPVAVGAGFLPLLGMLMLPKTVCYILLIVCFLTARNDSAAQ